MHPDLLRKRDVLNFMRWRDATEADDRAIAQLLLTTFIVTNAFKRPDLASTAERVRELNDVASRRLSGVVRLLEFGHRLIGTYALMRPKTTECLAWTGNAAYLRAVAIDPEFQGINLAESLIENAIQIARLWEVERICLHIVRGSDGLARLYGRFGYDRDPRGDQIGSGFELDGYSAQIRHAQEIA
jgi:GNAT superfamily N-acetyltransferase